MRVDWNIVKLGEVCGLQNGFAFKSKLFKQNGMPILRISNIQNDEIRDSRIVYTDPNDYNEDLSKYEVRNGDLLIAMSGATTGKIGFNNTNKTFLLNQRVGKFEPKKTLDKQYLYYFLCTRVEENLKISAGSAQPNLSTKQIKAFAIPLPPLSEQKRIVAILDEAFSGIEKVVANTEKNLSNARELFDTFLNSIFTQQNKNWRYEKLDNLCERITKGSSPKWQGIEYVKKAGILFVTSENIGQNRMVFDKTKYVEEKFNKKDAKSILIKGDVLTNIVGASIGRTAVFDRDDLANINQAVCLIRCYPDKLKNTFLSHLLNSPYFRQILHDNEINNARANLSLGFFKSLEIPLPPINTQEAIVARIDELAIETQHFEAIYRQKLTALTELKQSLLQKAFSGELTEEATKQAAA